MSRRRANLRARRRSPAAILLAGVCVKRNRTSGPHSPEVAFSNPKQPLWIFIAARSENSNDRGDDPLTFTKRERPGRRGGNPRLKRPCLQRPPGIYGGGKG